MTVALRAWRSATAAAREALAGAPPPRHGTRRLLLIGLGITYLVAFASLAVQVRGLLGPDGILPAGDVVARLRNPSAHLSIVDVPTVFAWTGASNDALLAVIAIGMLAGLAMVFDAWPWLAAAAAYLAYLSFVSVARHFLAFQWDALLLEAGFLALFLSPPTRLSPAGAATDPPRIAIFALRFLAFRLMLGSGVAKLASGDPTWRDLTALTFHHETTCLPAAFAYHAHHLPPAVHRAMAGFTLFVELLVPFGCFGPARLRKATFLAFAALLVGIAATGSYGFFQWLTLSLSVALLDDRDLPPGLSAKLAPGPAAPTPGWFRFCAAWVVAPVMLLGAHRLATTARLDATWPVAVRRMQHVAEPFRVANPYGLFARMTTTRPEIVLEASLDGVHFEAVTFPYKPVALDALPPHAGLHMPRLDWQLWFAALASHATRSPPFLGLCAGLLHGTPEVRDLVAHAPFHGRRPRVLRATLYRYRFTSPDERRRTGHVWRRERIGEYLPPVALGPTGQLVRVALASRPP